MKQEERNEETGVLLDHVMYDLDAFGYCGVLMPKHVMEKVIKLTHKHCLAVKETLMSHLDELEASHWTMARSEGGKEAVYVRFALGDSDETLRRIELFKPKQPEKRDEVYFVASYDDARAIAESKLKEVLA